MIAVSEFTRDWVRRYYGLDENKVRTAYNGVDAEAFRPADVEPPGPPVINFVGRTGVEKAADTLLRACLQLASRTTEFRLQIVGSNQWGELTMDEYQRELENLSSELEQRGIVVFRPGHIDRKHLPGVIRRAHIHVVPSRWDEPFGLTTLEGMASGLATVASNTGGTPEVVGDAGLLFERDDVGGLAEYLEQLVCDADHRRLIARRCRARAESFTWGSTWQRLREMLPADIAA